MGVYQYDDPITGEGFDFTIKGDTPSNTEFARISQIIKTNREAYGQQYQDFTGQELEIDDETAVRRGLRRGYQQIKGAVGETLGTAGEQYGLGFLADYGQDVEERARQRLGELLIEQPERMQSTDVDSIGSALTYAGELVGEQIPQLGLGLGAAIAAPAITPAALTTGAIGTFAVGATGAGLITAPILFGNNIQRQEDEVASGKKASVDVGAALRATFGQAALEGIADKILLGGMLRPLGKSIFTRTASRATGGATTEGLTEVGQQIMERAQAGLPIDSEDAIAEYREAAIAGGLIGGGTRATFGAFQGVPETEAEKKARLEAERAAAVTTDTDIGTDPTDTTPPEADKVEETIAAAEEITAVTDAQATEARNAADSTPPKGRAEQTDTQRAVAAADVDTSTDKQEAIAKEARLKQEEALRKTEKYTKPAVDPNAVAEDRDAALKSEQSGENIQVGVTEEVEVDAVTTDPDVIDDDFLSGLSVPKEALIRRKNTKISLIGKKKNDPAVIEALKKYAITSSVPTARQGVTDYLNSVGVSLERKSDTERLGVGVQSDQPSVAGRLERDTADTEVVAEPDVGRLGTDLPPVRDTADTTEIESDTLEEVTEDITKQADIATAEPVAPAAELTEAQKLAAERKRIRDTPGGYEAMVRNALKETGTRTPAEVLVEPDEIAARRARLAEGQPESLSVPTGPMTGAVGGAETGLAGQVIPEPVQVPPAPEMQAAPVPQEQLQAMEAQRDAAAQARIDRVFESNRGKQPQVREYHDTQVDPRSAPEVTTAVDKEGVADLLETPDKDLDTRAKAAKLFFKRFRRPVDALAEMGAVSAAGPAQSIEKDYTPVEFAFYKGMTQKSAMDARKWVFDNLSRQAFVETRNASVLARRDTAKYSPSDAYIRATKSIKQVLNNEQRRYNRQLEKDVEAYTEAKRAEAAAEQVNKQLALDTSMGAPRPMVTQAGEEIFRVTTPKKGLSTIEAALDGMDFKRRKVRKNETIPEDVYTLLDEVDGKEVLYVYQDTRNENELLTKEYYKEIAEGLEYSLKTYNMLLIDPVHGLDQALLPSIRNALQRGDLGFALDAIASTSQVDRIREIAAKLANVVGDTQVQVVDDLSQVVGRTAAGLFRPETNTILIDANRGMNVHTILHEMTHAATSAAIANPSLPETKQLQTLLDAARKQFGEVYGTRDLDEFIAEAFSNPEFQSALALTRVDGGKMSGWEKFTGAVNRIVRKLLGLSPSPSALTEIDRLIDGMLAPSPATRAAPDMLLAAGTRKGAADLLGTYFTAVPKEDRNSYERIRDVVLANTPRSVKNFALSLQPVTNLTRIAKERIPFAPELNVLIDQASGAYRKALEPVDVIYEDYRKFRKANRAAYDKMLGLMNRATQEEVDPARPRDTYAQYWLSYFDKKTEKTVTRAFKDEQARNAEIAKLNADLKADEDAGKTLTRTKAKKAGDADADKTAMWDVLNKEYKALGKQGQDLYKITRNMGESAMDRILPAMKARIDAMGVDSATKRTAFEKLADLLHAESGVIRPYFRLNRDGDFRLQYVAPDPLTGNDEVFTERYDSERKLLQAQENVNRFLKRIEREDLVSQIESGRDSGVRNYGKAPSSSFVFNLLQTLQATGVDQKTMDRVVDLALDAIPERSFMQSFRSRKERASGGRGVFGALGEVTPSGMPGMDADPAELFRTNFRGIEKQLVQLEYGAKIQQFRNKLVDGNYLNRLDTDVMARKLDKIAEFAQSPSIPNWSRIATSAGFGWTMGANISSAAVTLFDMPMSVFPYLSGEYGIMKATSAISNGAKLFLGSPETKTVTIMGADGQPVQREVKMGKFGKSMANYNYDDPNLPNDIKRYGPLVKLGTPRGFFNQSMTQEQLDITGDRDVLEKINVVNSFLFHHTERMGRETSLVAAYDLELNKLSDNGRKRITEQDERAAAEKALDSVELTLGGTAAAGRPVFAQNPVGNVVFLFKRFAVQRYYYMAHLLDQALSGADPETRSIAKKQLAQVFIMSGILAGVGGMPLMGAIGAIYNIFTDDDEDDFDAMMRKTIPGGMYDGFANEILGVDVASRVSMNSLLYRPPIVEKDQFPLWTLAEQIGGPVVGSVQSIWRGVKLLGEGEYLRGAEAALPAAARNLIRAYRFGTEGATTLRDDPIVKDINPYNTFMQGLGFAPADYIENLEKNRNERSKKNFIDQKRRKLMRRYNMARRNNDNEGVQKALRKIQEFNANLPSNYRVESRIDREDLRKSYKGFTRTTGNMVNGIVYTDAMRKSYEEYK